MTRSNYRPIPKRGSLKVVLGVLLPFWTILLIHAPPVAIGLLIWLVIVARPRRRNQ